jgi:phospholipase C
MIELTRRRMLTAAGAGVAASLLPPALATALAGDSPRRSSLGDIEHVVLLMQENRSFDHYFGTMAGVRGFNDPDAMTLPSGRSVFHQPDPANPDGYLLPFHLDTKRSSAQAIPATGHGWGVQHASWNGGTMDNWIPAHRREDGEHAAYVMGYYTRDDIPVQYALADSFTVCDNYFCSVFGPTWPNRLYWMTGTIDPGGQHGGPITRNSTPKGPYRWTTYAERLQSAGISWRVYREDDDYGCNMLTNFAAFSNAAPGTPLHENGLISRPAGTFEDDARNDRLPAVSWVICTSHQSEHPDFLPAAGADFVAGKLAAIAANPKVWRKTAFILNYDENDGLFDHVPPPVAPPGTPDEYVGGLPIGAGFRVPAVVISPWTSGGWVARERFDHTSCLRFLERFTGVEEPNISEWRRRTFGDLTSAFRFRDTRSRFPGLPTTGRQLDRARWEVAHLPKPRLPGGDQRLPQQQPGLKPHTR